MRWIRYYCSVPAEKAQPEGVAPGPFWVLQHRDPSWVTLIVTVRSRSDLRKAWPAATEISQLFRSETIPFSGSFPCPLWWDAAQECVK